MKANIWLLGAILASSTLVTTAHADNATRVAATSALGSVVGTAIGKEIGGNNGAMIGSALGGAGGADDEDVTVGHEKTPGNEKGGAPWPGKSGPVGKNLDAVATTALVRRAHPAISERGRRFSTCGVGLCGFSCSRVGATFT